MSSDSKWNNVSISFGENEVFQTVTKTLSGFIKGLRVADGLLTKAEDVLKLYALISALNAFLVFILAIKNQLKTIIDAISGTGIYVLPVLPDPGRSDWRAMLQSVQGGISGFETRLNLKFNDVNDANRPKFGNGSYAAWAVFYVDAGSPGNLVYYIDALLKLLNMKRFGVLMTPTAIDVKALPVAKSDSVDASLVKIAGLTWDLANQLASFVPLSNSYQAKKYPVEPEIAVQWAMATEPDYAGDSTFLAPTSQVIAELNSLIRQFTDVGFIIERSDFPAGEEITTTKYTDTLPDDLPVTKNAPVFEPTGEPFRGFSKKIVIEPGLVSKKATSPDFYTGILSNEFIYRDTEIEPNTDYYYRVRCFTSINLNTTKFQDYIDNKYDDLIIEELGVPVIQLNQANIGKPSPIVHGRARITEWRDLYTAAFDAVKAAIILNYELPPAGGTDDLFLFQSKTGWGSFTDISYHVMLAKSSTGKTTKSFFEPLVGVPNPIETTEVLLDLPNFVDQLVDRIVSNVLERIENSDSAVDLIRQAYEEDGLKDVIKKILDLARDNEYGLITTQQSFFIPGTLSGSEYINGFLRLSQGPNTNPKNGYRGPIPLNKIGIAEREDLAKFLRLLLVVHPSPNNINNWHKMTIGELFPGLVRIFRKLEKIIEAILEAIEKAIKKIKKIIESIRRKIRALERLVRQILDLVNALNITINIAALFGASNDASPQKILNSIVNAQDKPFSTTKIINADGEEVTVPLAYSYYSGLVVVAASLNPDQVSKLFEIIKLGIPD